MFGIFPTAPQQMHEDENSDKKQQLAANEKEKHVVEVRGLQKEVRGKALDGGVYGQLAHCHECRLYGGVKKGGEPF